MSKKRWEPLNDHYVSYVADLSAASDEGLLSDPEIRDTLVYPHNLYLAETEKDEVRRFIDERMQEIVGHVQATEAFDPNLVATHLFRTLMIGMRWEQERIG